MCDGCNEECHFLCATPVVHTVPTGDWFCVKCCAGEGLDVKKERR
jgi:hypothetical protein